MVSTCFNPSIWSCHVMSTWWFENQHPMISHALHVFWWESDTPASETRKNMKRDQFCCASEAPWTGLKRRRPTCPWQQCAYRLPKRVFLGGFDILSGDMRRELEKDCHGATSSRRYTQRNKHLTSWAIPTLCLTYSGLQRLQSRSPTTEAAKFFVVPHGATHLGPQPTRGTLKSLISHWLGYYYPRFAAYPSLQWLTDKLQDDTKSTDLWQLGNELQPRFQPKNHPPNPGCLGLVIQF